MAEELGHLHITKMRLLEVDFIYVYLFKTLL
jgi:hypothetical protein